MIDRPTFDELKNMMGVDFVSELIDTYNQETGQLIEQLQQALISGDSATFGRLAHSIKSSSASLGALDFSQQARELEMLGKANNLTEAGPKLQVLSTDFLQVVRNLEELKNEP